MRTVGLILIVPAPITLIVPAPITVAAWPPGVGALFHVEEGPGGEDAGAGGLSARALATATAPGIDRRRSGKVR
jgi:hypothetical protein